MELEVLFWALAFMLGTFAIGGAAYLIYHHLVGRRP
jgi:hypothetical protein